MSVRPRDAAGQPPCRPDPWRQLSWAILSFCACSAHRTPAVCGVLRSVSCHPGLLPCGKPGLTSLWFLGSFSAPRRAGRVCRAQQRSPAGDSVPHEHGGSYLDVCVRHEGGAGGGRGRCSAPAVPGITSQRTWTPCSQCQGTQGVGGLRGDPGGLWLAFISHLPGVGGEQ